MPVVESNITLNFPDDNFFRFQECPGYTRIQDHFKEMDVCWYDAANDVLYLIELKDWGPGLVLNEESDPGFPAEQIAKIKENITLHRIMEVLKKSIDSLSMFNSILMNKPYSPNIQACSPFNISLSTTIKLITIVNWDNPDLSHIAFVHDAYKSRFKPYAKLFGIKTYVVMTKNQARNSFDWVI